MLSTADLPETMVLPDILAEAAAAIPSTENRPTPHGGRRRAVRSPR